jgi:hypothetical protein
MGQGGELEGSISCFGGLAALSESLRRVAWLPRFRPDMPARFDELSDPVEFLQLYAIAIRATGGDGRVMANWFPMATKGEPRLWLWGLPQESISSWRGLCDCFIDKFTKWAEVESVCTIPARSAFKFIRGLVCRFCVPNRIITDNDSHFTSGLFWEYCASVGIKIYFAAIAYPRSNRQAERTNAEALKGLKTRSFNSKIED